MDSSYRRVSDLFQDVPSESRKKDGKFEAQYTIEDEFNAVIQGMCSYCDIDFKNCGINL